jgi:Domain of unknown function (DUF4349)
VFGGSAAILATYGGRGTDLGARGCSPERRGERLGARRFGEQVGGGRAYLRERSGDQPEQLGHGRLVGRMIIRNANLALTVSDVEATLGSIRDIAQASGGYVATSQSQYVGEKVNATITLQVPATSFDGVVQQIEKLALKVDTEQVTSQDVTEEFVDAQAQINNLKATEQTMVRLLDRATQMDEILAIQRELTNVRGQIEKLQGRVNYLQRRSDFSTITIRVSPVSTPIDPNASSTWRPLKTISDAWQASLEAITTVVDVLLAIVFYLWWLIAIVALAVWLWRRGHRRPQTPAPVPAAAAGPGPSAPPPAGPGAG